MTTSNSTFDRLFPFSHWYKSNAWLVVAGSIVSNLILLCQLLCVLFLVGLFETRGSLDISTKLVNEIKEGKIQVDTSKLGINLSKTEDDKVMDIPVGKFEDLGLVPLGIYYRNQYLGKVILTLCQKIPALRNNSEALLVLLLSLAILALLRSFINVRSKLIAQNVALEQVNLIRRSIHRQAMRLGPSDLKDQAKGEVIQLFTTDLDTVRKSLADWMYRISHHPLMILVLFLTTISINWKLSLQCLFPLALCWYIIQREYLRWQPVQSSYRKPLSFSDSSPL